MLMYSLLIGLVQITSRAAISRYREFISMKTTGQLNAVHILNEY